VKAFVFSIGEKTTDLCVELLKEYGFEVVLYQDKSSLWEKLKRFYTEALESDDEKFMRIDADIIPNRNVLRLTGADGWECASGFDWYSQDRKAISIHVMDRFVIRQCLENIYEAQDKVRPETHLWRHEDVNDFTSIQADFNSGLHGYAQGDQRKRIKALKESRNQNYDWDLLDRIESL
jgi:hypothetical protein